VLLTFKYRVKDATSGKHLAALARTVNRVWNYCGEIQEAARRHNKRWPSAYDLIRLTTGSASMLGVHSDTVQAVCKQFVASRNAHGKRPKWRGRRSLGWVPFAASRAIKIDGDTVVHLKRRYRFWNSRRFDAQAIHCGNFAQDASGRWYINLQVDVPERQDCGPGKVGIDLGVQSLAALSDGRKIPNLRHFRKHARALAKAQKARNKKRTSAIHAKIANARRHHLHEQSTRLVRENKLIVVGDIRPRSAMDTDLPGKGGRNIRKSVLDASWSAFRSMLRYKAIGHGAEYIEADESESSATCSACGAHSGPEGIAGSRMRVWDCDGCGTRHDRDTNAALNFLLALERQRPAGEIPGV
jgi:IS605 OrfB family transposase